MASARKPATVINSGGGATGFVFFLAFLGALVYFIQNSEGFWGIVLAFFKAVVWPALVTYRALELLQL